MDGEDVVGHPEHVGLIAIENPLDFLGHVQRPSGGDASCRTSSGCTSGNDTGSRAP